MSWPDEYEVGLRALEESSLAGDGIPRRVKHLAIALAYANKGRDDEAHSHGDLALDAGLTRPELIEALMAGVLSRGLSVTSAHAELLARAPEAGGADIAGAPTPPSNEITGYFQERFGSVPEWLAELADTSPDTLESYYGLRAEILRDAVLPRRLKELLLVTINSAERYDVGVQVHARGALESGASSADVYEAIRTAIVPGGLVAWIAGADATRQVIASHDSAAAARE